MTPRPARRVAAVRAGLAIAGLAIAVAACDASGVVPQSPAAASPAAGSPAATPVAAPGSSPAAPPTMPPVNPSADPGASGAVVVDPALLGVLPASVDGVEVVESSDGEADGLADPELARIGARFAAGLAVDPASGAFVYAVVVALRPDAAFDEGTFRDWRDSFDEGACSQAGGVTGKAEAELGGRTVHIGSCTGGVLTYHARIPGTGADDPGLLVSASALGERRLGEHLMENLQP